MSIKLKVKTVNGSQGYMEFKDTKSILIGFMERRDIVDIDLSPLASNSRLKSFTLTFNALQSIDLSPLSTCKGLESVSLYRNQLKRIDLSPLSKCKNLSELRLDSNQLKKIDLSPLGSNKNLEILNLSENHLKKIDLSPLSSCTELKVLNLDGNHLPSIDLSPLSSCTNLETIWLQKNQLRSIDLSLLTTCPNLRFFHLNRNKLKRVDLSPLSARADIRRVSISLNQLESINLTPLKSCIDLDSIELNGNGLRTIDLSPLSSCINISSIELSRNRLQTIDLSPLSSIIGIQFLNLDENMLKTVDISPLSSCPHFRELHLKGDSFEGVDITPLVTSPYFNYVETDAPVTSWIKDPFQRRLVTRNAQISGRRERFSVESPAQEGSWELLHKLANIPYGLSIPIQTYILKALGLEKYGLIDADISGSLCSISPDLSLDEARERVKPILVERMCEQIDRGGTTIGLDVDGVFTEAMGIAKRMESIAKLRDAEMKRIVAIRKGEFFDVRQLYLTAYGHSILNNVWQSNVRGISNEEFDLIQDSLSTLGYEIIVVRYEVQFPATDMSIHMKQYVSSLYGWNKAEMQRQEKAEVFQLKNALEKAFKKDKLRAILRENNIRVEERWTKHILAKRIMERMGVDFVRGLLEQASYTFM
ncbi:MAG: leucine-rich repeat domain-containing protein [Candidatus Thorarchaeota archaeon]